MKRAIDFVLATALAVVLLPLLAVIAILILVSIGPPVLFRQSRPGLHSRAFTLYKFRTMTDKRDENNKLLADKMRLTPLGIWLRRTSLDELPELFNVLIGTMSLVGPRPLLLQYVNRYSPEQARRHEAIPGITGWAQINGRNAISWEDKFRLDVWYVDNRSIGLDLKIMFLTVAKIVSREGINQPGSATQEEFLGSGKGKRHERQIQ